MDVTNNVTNDVTNNRLYTLTEHLKAIAATLLTIMDSIPGPDGKTNKDRYLLGMIDAVKNSSYRVQMFKQCCGNCASMSDMHLGDDCYHTCSVTGQYVVRAGTCGKWLNCWRFIRPGVGPSKVGDALDVGVDLASGPDEHVEIPAGDGMSGYADGKAFRSCTDRADVATDAGKSGVRFGKPGEVVPIEGKESRFWLPYWFGALVGFVSGAALIAWLVFSG